MFYTPYSDPDELTRNPCKRYHPSPRCLSLMPQAVKAQRTNMAKLQVMLTYRGSPDSQSQKVSQDRALPPPLRVRLRPHPVLRNLVLQKTEGYAGMPGKSRIRPSVVIHPASDSLAEALSSFPARATFPVAGHRQRPQPQ